MSSLFFLHLLLFFIFSFCIFFSFLSPSFPCYQDYTFVMMGTASENRLEDVKPTVKFIEDMTEAEIAKELDFSPGLENLGNTCYANATIQCLGAVPELKSALEKFEGSTNGDASQAIPAGLRELYRTLGSSTSSVSPIVFILVGISVSFSLLFLLRSFPFSFLLIVSFFFLPLCSSSEGPSPSLIRCRTAPTCSRMPTSAGPRSSPPSTRS